MPDADAAGVAKNSSWLLARNAASAGLLFIQGLVVARQLGAAGYGLFGLITAYVAVVNQVIDFRIYEFATRYVSEFWEKGRKGECLAAVKAAYLLDVSTGLAAFALVAATAWLAAAHILHEPGLAALVVLSAGSLLFSTANGTASAILGVFGRFPWLTLHSVLHASARFLLVIAALAAGKGLYGVVLACVAADLFGGLLINFLAARVVKEKLWEFRGEARLALLKARFREMASFLAYTNLNEFLSLFTRNVDVLFLGYFRGAAEAGLYKLAKSFAGAVGLLAEPLYTSVFPAITGLIARGERARAASLARRLSLTAAAIFIPLCAAMALAAPFLVTRAAGAAYLAAAPALGIMVWGGAVGGIFAWVRPMLLAIGRADVPAKINAAGAALLVACSVVLVPRYGYLASAAVSLLPWVLGHAAALLFLRGHFAAEAAGDRK